MTKSGQLPTPHPAIREAKGVWSVLLGVIVAIFGIVVAMHPEWGVFGFVCLVFLTTVFLVVLGWWAWSLGAHLQTLKVSSARWIYLLTAEIAAILAVAFAATFLFLPKVSAQPQGFRYIPDPHGDTIMFGDPRSLPKKAEARIHFDKDDRWIVTYRDNVLSPVVVGSNFHFHIFHQRSGLETQDEVGIWHIVLVLSAPMSYTEKDISVNFNQPRFPAYTIQQATPNIAVIALQGKIPEGDLDVFIDGSRPEPAKLPLQP